MTKISLAMASLRTTRAILRLRDQVAGRAVAAAKVPLSEVSYDRGAKRLVLPLLGLRVDPAREDWFLRGYYHAIEVARHAGARFSRAAGGEIEVDTGQFRANVSSEDQLVMLHEIFCCGVYDLRYPGPVVVWDIGMNVGLASLYFASRGARHVVAYEPFEVTYRQALRNFRLNPFLSSVIEAKNAGLGAVAEETNGFLDPNLPGNSGVSPQADIEAGSTQYARARIRLMDAGEELRELREKFPGLPIAAKIDCEGAEYGVINRLIQSKTLRELSFIMLEWHRRLQDHDPAALVEALTSGGFASIVLSLRSARYGMLYAARV